jgi:hypothetical protein
MFRSGYCLALLALVPVLLTSTARAQSEPKFVFASSKSPSSKRRPLNGKRR